MEITIHIDEDAFEKPMHDAASRIIADIINRAVAKRIGSISTFIDNAVERYLDKNLDSNKIAEMVNNNLNAQLIRKIEDAL